MYLAEWKLDRFNPFRVYRLRINCTLRNGNGWQLSCYPNSLSINCTLRNGNDTKINTSVKKYAVLIVPCGMETNYRRKRSQRQNGINCTLRNGNRSGIHVFFHCDRINCTLRNGNATSTGVTMIRPGVLIVPCGMETKNTGTCQKIILMY